MMTNRMTMAVIRHKGRYHSSYDLTRLSSSSVLPSSFRRSNGSSSLTRRGFGAIVRISTDYHHRRRPTNWLKYHSISSTSAAIVDYSTFDHERRQHYCSRSRRFTHTDTTTRRHDNLLSSSSSLSPPSSLVSERKHVNPTVSFTTDSTKNLTDHSTEASLENQDYESSAETPRTSTTATATTTPTNTATTSTTTTTTTSSKTKAYLDLAKAKLSALVVTTTAAGFVAAGGPLYEQIPLATACIVGTALCSSSAAAWNQIFEVDRDAQMKRTQQRPLVTGVLTQQEAKIAATLWGISGTTILAVGTDPVTATLGLSNIVLYSGLYTYMKPRSVYNTQVGGIVGAIPPLMGWTAATGGSILDMDALILASTLYLWQMPHFFALSYMHRVDYKRGGFAMLPVLESDGEATSATILRNATYLSVVPFVSTLTGVTSSMFALEGIALNSYALYVAFKFRQERINANARKVFLTSLWYLPCWLTLFLLHSKVWDEEKDRDVLRDAISDTVHRVREQGKKLCIHERAVARQHPVDGDEACPVQLTKKGSDAVQQVTTNSLRQANRTQKEV